MKPHEIPDVSLEHLARVFGDEGADLEPEDFKWVRVLVDYEVARRRRARRSGTAGSRVKQGR